MTQLELRIPVEGNAVLYETAVVDTTPGAEFSLFEFRISGSMIGLSESTMESAVRAFAQSLADSSENFEVSSLKKVTVNESNLTV